MREPAVLLLAYLIGSVSSATILVRLFKGADIRTLGSRSAGATNVLRTSGKALGAATLLLDVLKGTVSVLLMQLVTYDPRWTGAAAVAATVGHIVPVFFGFHGGKGVATAMGGFLVLSPLATLAAVATGLAVIGVTRFVSLGSVTGACLLGIFARYLAHAPEPLVAAAAVLAFLLLFSHRTNIARLARGEERKLGKRETE